MGLADAVAEFKPFHDLGQAVLAIGLAPLALRGDHIGFARRSYWLCAAIISLNAIARPVWRLRHPVVRFVRWRTVAEVLSVGFVVRMCFQCPAGQL